MLLFLWYSKLFPFAFEEERSDWLTCFNQVGANEIPVWLCSCVFSSWRHRGVPVISDSAFPGHVVIKLFHTQHSWTYHFNCS